LFFRYSLFLFSFKINSKIRVNTLDMSSNVNTEARSSRASSSSNMLTTEKMRGRSSSDMINSNNRISTSSSSGFDVQRVYETFVASLREADNPKSPIGTQDYIDGYRELLK
jgi:hypothetical protein